MSRPRALWARRAAIGLPLMLLVVLVAAWSLRASWLPGLGHWLDVGESPHRTDYVLVLAGGETTRPFVAGALLRAGLARYALLISAEAPPSEEDGDAAPTGKIAQDVLLAMGVGPERLHILPGRSNSTFGDAQLLRSFLEQHPQATVAVVTNHFHTRRSRWVFRHVLGDNLDLVRFLSAPADGFELDNWWRTKNGCMSCVIEYAKLLIYWFLYGSGWLVGCGCVAIAIAAALLRRSRARTQPVATS